MADPCTLRLLKMLTYLRWLIADFSIFYRTWNTQSTLLSFTTSFIDLHT